MRLRKPGIHATQEVQLWSHYQTMVHRMDPWYRTHGTAHQHKTPHMPWHETCSCATYIARITTAMNLISMQIPLSMFYMPVESAVAFWCGCCSCASMLAWAGLHY